MNVLYYPQSATYLILKTGRDIILTTAQMTFAMLDLCEGISLAGTVECIICPCNTKTFIIPRRRQQQAYIS